MFHVNGTSSSRRTYDFAFLPSSRVPSGWPRLLRRMLFWRATHGLLLADLARGRLRLDRLSRNGGGSTFFPWASPIPREARKSPRRHPPLRSSPCGCGVDRLRPADRHRGRDGRGARNSTGEVTWPTS